jgi:transposase
VKMSLRGVLRNFGLRVGKVAARDFPFRIRELVAEHADLTEVAESLLRVREVLVREFSGFERRVRRMARQSPQAQLLMSTPGVGAIVSLTYASAIDDPARFASSKRVGAHFGMTPKRYQSGQIDYTGRISKIGDSRVRTALYEAANIILTKPIKGCTSLKSWAMRIAKRAGMAKAKVALARKLAVIMHRMLADGQPFNAAAAAA